jgi:thiol peroxidase
MNERTGLIKFGGKDVTIVGCDIQIGDQAPPFHAQTSDWTLVEMISATKGKVRIIAAIPSLDTSVCDRETRRFNVEAAKLGTDIAIIVVSTDLPFAQKRWCGATGVEQVDVVSDHMSVEFGVAYGCLIKEARLLRRAVFVVNKHDKISYVEYMPSLGEEPDYEKLLQAAKDALN